MPGEFQGLTDEMDRSRQFGTIVEKHSIDVATREPERNGDYYIVYLAENAGMSEEEKTQMALEAAQDAAQKEFGDSLDSQEPWNVDRLGENTIEVVNGKRRSATSMNANWATEYNDMKGSDLPKWYRHNFMQEINAYWMQDGKNELLRGSYEIYLVTPPQHE